MVVQATPVASRQLLDVVLFADQLVEFGRYGHLGSCRTKTSNPMACCRKCRFLGEFGMVGDVYPLVMSK